MSDPSNQAKSIFLVALEEHAPEQWPVFLDAACAGDAVLRVEVEKLLRSRSELGSFHEAARPFVGATLDQPVAERPGMVIGPYKLLEQIGEGGFGVVYMAEQTRPVRRKVALKVLKPGMDTRQVVVRFEAERQALALMDHPNIAKVFDGGATATGRPYFVMELVKGVPITDFCDQHQLTPRQRLELFLPVCQAVQHAHQKGIIHRDLKPSNVLVSRHDTTAVVKVIDFGVAKALGQELTDKTLFTGIAQMIGTPLYMSPEQAGMSDLDIDTRSDIYALGVLLYELLTGTTPFDKERLRTAGYEEIRRIIREEEPARPSARLSTLGQAAVTLSASRQSDPKKLGKLMRGELDWIVMKALDKDRNRRYESASAFAADVQRYLADEPVQACPPSAWYRFRKLARRNRGRLAAAAVLGVALLAVVGALAVSTILVWQFNKDLQAAVERERREAYFQRITVAHHELSTDNLAATLRALQECPEDLRQFEWYYLMRLCRVEPTILPGKTAVNGVAFSPDGKRLASAVGDGTVKIWDIETRKVVQEFRAHDKTACSVAFHPDGRHIVSTGADGLKVWDLTTLQEVFRRPCDAWRKIGAAYTVAFSPDGRLLAAGSQGAVRVWDWENGKLLHTFPERDSVPISVAFSRDGQRLATGSWRESPRLWNPLTGEGPLCTFVGHRHPIDALAFSPDGKRLASGSFDTSVKVWDTTSGEILHTFWHNGNVDAVAFSPDGRRLASGGEDKTVCLWDPETDRQVLGLRGHTGKCTCVAFSPDGRRLVSASADGTIRIWDARPLQGDEGQELLTFKHEEKIRCVAFSPDGQRIASADSGADVKVWDAATGRVSAAFNGDMVVFSLAWRPPDGEQIASAGMEGKLFAVKVWDVLRTDKPTFALRGGKEYFAVTYSPKGDYLVTGRQDGAVQVWDARFGHEVGTLGSHDSAIRGLVFSRDGRHLVSASQDGEVKLWDATLLDREQNARHVLQARVPGPSVNVAFSPDGRRLATGGEDNTVKIWDVQTGKELRTLRGHRGEVYTLAFSPDDDGRLIASGGEDSTVKVWDSLTGTLVRSFRGHTGLISSLAFSPDGRRLASGSRDATVKVWDVTPLRNVPRR